MNFNVFVKQEKFNLKLKLKLKKLRYIFLI